MSNWTVNGTTAAGLNIERLQMSFRSLAAGSCRFQVSGAAVNAAPLFAFEQQVSIARDGTVLWTGPVVSPAVAAGASAENHVFEVSDPWYYLDHQSFMQLWALRGGTVPPAYSPRCILGRSAGPATFGAPISAGDAIREILAYAHDVCGLPVSAGEINLPQFFKQEEVAAVTCREAIVRILKWFPDAVGWWTFGGTPQLNIGRRADLNLLTVAVGDPRLAGENCLSIAPQPELRPGSVVLIYEINNVVDGQSCIDQVRDAAPDGSTGQEFRALTYPIPLNGYDRHFLKERVLTENIEVSVGDPDGLRRARIFWGAALGLTGKVKAVSGDAHVPELFFSLLPSGFYFDRSLPMVNLADGSYDPLANATDAEKQRLWHETHPLVIYNTVNARDARKITLDTDLTRVLIDGAVRPWMSGITAQRQVFTAKVAFTPLGGSSGRTPPQIMSAILVATNATTQTYTALDAVTNGESVPEGVAASLYAALSHDHYAGAVRFEQEECDGFLALGNKLNITGGQPGWATMAAVISQVDLDIESGTTTAHIGPAKHLAPADFVSLLCAQRGGLGKTGAGAANIRPQQQGYS